MARIVSIMVIVLLLSVGAYAEKAPQKVVDYAKTTLAAFGNDGMIVKAVKAENAKGKTLAQIKDMDAKWRGDAGIAPYMKELMTSECGMYLKEIQAKNNFIEEIFVMDNQGANVCQTDKTSDYWQGDEAKFTESFSGGSGAVHMGDVEFDDSAQAYLVQVSVPVKDGGKAIGAITFGINVDKF